MIKTLTDRSFYMDLLQTIRRSGLSVRASSLAYSLLMASIPLLLIFLQLASLFLNNPQLALNGVWNILPTQVAHIFQEVIRVHLYYQPGLGDLFRPLAGVQWD